MTSHSNLLDMNRLATRVTLRAHAYKDNGKQEAYFTDTYEVGRHHAVPHGKGTDEVMEIRVSDSWKPHIEIEYLNWGEEWKTEYIVSIEFYNHEQYTEALRKKEEARKLRDTGIQ